MYMRPLYVHFFVDESYSAPAPSTVVTSSPVAMARPPSFKVMA